MSSKLFIPSAALLIVQERSNPLQTERSTQQRHPTIPWGGLGNAGRGRRIYDCKPASLFDGYLLSSPFHQGIQAR